MDWLEDTSLEEVIKKARAVQIKGGYQAAGYHSAWSAVVRCKGQPKSIRHFWPDVVFIATDRQTAKKFRAWEKSGSKPGQEQEEKGTFKKKKL